MGAGRLDRCAASLDRLIVAFCADYDRRKLAIELRSVSTRTEMEYKYLNHRIFEGAAEIVGAAYAELYIYEIGSGVGYANSRHPASSESTYKREKQEVKHRIAEKLHLA